MYTIAVDFDGTCVTHNYPFMGKDIGAVPVLKKIIENGNLIILYTMRDGQELQDAIDWFKVNDIKLYDVNNNPTQAEWTSSRKVYAHLYIDDAALGCPLIVPENPNERNYVNWVAVEQLLEWLGVIK